MISRVVCWNTVLTDHQAPLYRELHKLYPGEVFVFKKEDINRKMQGWTAVDSTGLNIKYFEPKFQMVKAVHKLILHRNDVHIFGNPFDRLSSIVLVFAAAFMRIRFFLISEPFNTSATSYVEKGFPLSTYIRAILRPVVYKIYCHLIKDRVSGIFAISSTSVAQYKRAGIPECKIFPFAYFPYFRFKTDFYCNTKHDVNNILKLIFIGALIPRKGLANLLRTVKKFNEKGWGVTLDCFGPGDSSIYAFSEPSSTYRGVLQFGSAAQTISRYDLLILPSVFDGWGVVCNEAVLVGVPVVCSSDVGFSGVVSKWGCGLTYEQHDPGGLEDALSFFLANPDRVYQMRENALSVAAGLEPSVGAQYVAAVIRHIIDGSERPSAIWYDCE